MYYKYYYLLSSKINLFGYFYLNRLFIKIMYFVTMVRLMSHIIITYFVF